MTIHERADGISHVELVGKLDIAGLHGIDVRFHGATAARKQSAIVDISRLEFVASPGIGMFVSCAQSLQREGVSMVLVGAAGDVDRALRTAGIDQAMSMVDSEADALAVLEAD